MSNSNSNAKSNESKNFVICITGSIATYKAAVIMSRLRQWGHNVQVVATESALEFIGNGTIEGLTDRPVLTGMFEKHHHKAHIALDKWADLILVYPASANTIAALRAGLANNLLQGLFLANNFQKPYWIAPAMNVNMLDHPATKENLKVLESWGSYIFPTGEGKLACGDTGRGRVIDPEFVLEKIKSEILATRKF